jgi:hypothetical protein
MITTNSPATRQKARKEVDIAGKTHHPDSFSIRYIFLVQGMVIRFAANVYRKFIKVPVYWGKQVESMST